MKSHTAIEIDSPAVFDFVKLIEPLYEDLEYKNVHLKFAVFGFPSKGDVTIIRPEQFKELFDHIELGVYIRLRKFIHS
jgi:hypothetical protein